MLQTFAVDQFKQGVYVFVTLSDRELKGSLYVYTRTYIFKERGLVLEKNFYHLFQSS